MLHFILDNSEQEETQNKTKQNKRTKKQNDNVHMSTVDGNSPTCSAPIAPKYADNAVHADAAVDSIHTADRTVRSNTKRTGPDRTRSDRLLPDPMLSKKRCAPTLNATSRNIAN